MYELIIPDNTDNIVHIVELADEIIFLFQSSYLKQPCVSEVLFVYLHIFTLLFG